MNADRVGGVVPAGIVPGGVALTNDVVDTTDSAFLVDKVTPDEILVISFAFVSWDTHPAFDFFGRLKKLESRYPRPINRILLRDAQNAWYHRGVAGLGTNVDEVAAGLADLVRQIRPSRVVTIGQSMGAYAAVMFGALLGADRAIAFGPLSFLNTQQALLYHDRRWLSVMQKLEATPPPVRYFDLPSLCRQRGTKTHVDIVFGTKPDVEGGTDSVNLDAMHAQRFDGLPNVSLHPFPESGHAIVKFLIDGRLIDDLLFQLIVRETANRPAVARPV